MRTIILIAYLVIGVLVATAQDYMGEIDSIGAIVNLVLAIVLWPLLLLGVDFNLNIGGDDGGRDRNGNRGRRNGALFLLGPALVYGRATLSSAQRKLISRR